MSARSIRHPLLEVCGVEHGFGVRDASGPSPLVRPRQVHGIGVARPDREGVARPEEADAIVSDDPGRAVAVVTADCVPVLACDRSGRAVAAIHAGWKGLALGAIPEAVAALRRLAGPAASLVAVVGPCIGQAHYEVDEPVLGPLRERFGSGLRAALAPSRPAHALLDLAELARQALADAGLGADRVALLEDACTYSDPQRFFSYRRDGARAGRLVHFIRPAGPAPRKA